MAEAINPTGKRAIIDKTNSRLVIMASVAAFIFVFSLVATKTLVSQSNYQNHVITEKRKTLKQLRSDVTAVSQLESSYQAFTTTSQNALGGDPNGKGAQDGDNTKIVLDALPSTYDFPALVTSIEAMLSSQPVTTNNISGNDDEVAQSANQSSATPQPMPMPFQLRVTGNYSGVQGLISELQRSIRPMEIQTLQLCGSQDKLTLTITAQTYYQPAKQFKITTKVVK